MGNSILSIGLSALNAAQRGLLVAGHNVSNAATPGYTRQQSVQSTSPVQATVSGFIGQGVQIDTVTRTYNDLLAHQVAAAKTDSSQLDTYLAQMKQLDSLFADPSGRLGLSPALQDFFNSVQDVATNPAESASRQSMLSNAEVLARRFQSMSSRLDEIQSGANSQIENSVSLINTLSERIAKLNETISLSESAVNGQPANDLRDQRDELVMQLNQEVGAKAIDQGNGGYSVFIGSGQTLVAGSTAFKLDTVPSPLDPARLQIAYTSGSASIPVKESSLSGGKLSGLLQFRNEAIDAARNGLGRVAIGLAGTFNEQHRLGQDIQGNPGSDFFTMPSPTVQASSKNVGTAIVGAQTVSYGALGVSDYRLRFDGANYSLSRLMNGVEGPVQTFTAFPQTIDGISLSLASGAMAAGDEFLVRPTASGASELGIAIQDTSLIAAAAPIRTESSLANTGTGRISGGTVDAPPPPSPNLKQPVTITFTSSTTFDISGTGTGNPSGVTFTPVSPISYNGWTVQITGSPKTGDIFSVGPNANGSADNRNALLLGALQTSNSLAGGTASYQSAYGQTVSLIGNKTRELEVTSKAQAALLSQTQALQQSESGVNLDEEAANLLRYQQAYQAASKVIQTAGEMFEALLAATR
jgi:flagellar hook-associated protein 1 FlgK